MENTCLVHHLSTHGPLCDFVWTFFSELSHHWHLLLMVCPTLITPPSPYLTLLWASCFCCCLHFIENTKPLLFSHFYSYLVSPLTDTAAPQIMSFHFVITLMRKINHPPKLAPSSGICCMESACSPRVCVGFLWVLRFPKTCM